MEQIGVRELRQNASVFLRAVASGSSFEVTDRGRPVALLVPVPDDPWDRLFTSGAVIEPTVAGDLLDGRAGDFGIDASGDLARMRELER